MADVIAFPCPRRDVIARDVDERRREALRQLMVGRRRFAENGIVWPSKGSRVDEVRASYEAQLILYGAVDGGDGDDDHDHDGDNAA